MSATTTLRCTHGWRKFSVGCFCCWFFWFALVFYIILLFFFFEQVKILVTDQKTWVYGVGFSLFWISSCGLSAVTHATVLKFVLLPISFWFPAVMFVWSSASCWITILLLFAKFHLYVCWWIWAFISSNLHRMLNHLIVLVAPIS